MDILIVGYGNIGKHIYEEFEGLKPDIYDPNLADYCKKKNKQYGLAFICVPTNRMDDGSCDVSVVERAVCETNAEIIVIKSTVPPGTTNRLLVSSGKNIIFSPEHYGVTQHCESDSGFVILGGDKSLCDKAAQAYCKVKNGYYKFYFTDTVTAELGKYMLNSFLALKVTFCNEFAGIAGKFGISYSELRELFVADARVGPSHTFSYADKPYYDSHCFNKDIPALVKFADGKAPLISCMNDINLARRTGMKYDKKPVVFTAAPQEDKTVAPAEKPREEKKAVPVAEAPKSGPYECSICLIIRDENEYLEEWLKWHIGQGVQHFYIYDHGSKQPVSEFIKALDSKITDMITVIDWSGSHDNAQPDAYNNCLRRFGKDNKWLGFIDADEHVRVKTGQKLPEFLKNYEDHAGLFAVWLTYHANGQKYKSNLPLRQRFQKITPVRTWSDRMGKVFVQPSRMKDMYIHNGHVQEGYRIVGEYKDKVPDGQIWKERATTELICVDHYYTKSYEEWLEKLQRGSCHAHYLRKYHEFFGYNPDMEYCREDSYPAQGYEISLKDVPEAAEAS